MECAYDIRFATFQDGVSVKRLMGNVFHDEDRFLNLFFSYFFPDNLLLGFKADEVVSMAFLLPAKLIVNRKKVNATYLYACATSEHERGKGWMQAMINSAWEISSANGEAGLFLLPASESLYDYYEKLDFHNFFYWDKKEFHFDRFPEIADDYQLKSIDSKQYHDLRQELLQEEFAIHYPVSHFHFIETENQNPDSGFYEIRFEDHFAIAHLDHNKEHVFVRELLGEIEAASFAKHLSERYCTHRVAIIENGGTLKSAMLRPTEDYRFLVGGQGYFNWGLD